MMHNSMSSNRFYAEKYNLYNDVRCLVIRAVASK